MAQQANDVLAKTNRINLLFDFYGPLLTEKQRMFLTYYFHDDYSLGEIAEQYAVSRQAIYEHIKRAENVLEAYEGKLQLLAKHERRHQLAAGIRHKLSHISEADDLLRMVDNLISEF